jgi:Ala-tRNA(Pro) deacylase
MEGLTNHLKAGSGNLRAGDADVMEQLLGVKKGAVNLFSILNDTAKKVLLIVDQKLMDNFPLVAFHPMQNDATTAISQSDMKKVIELSNHEAEVIDFSQLVIASEGGEEAKEAQPEAKKPQKGQPKKEEVK